MSDKNYTVYMHTCPNGKVYIGITRQSTKQRWRNGKGYRNQPLFYRAICKFGWNNIKHEILFDNLSREAAEQKEIEFIKKYNSNDIQHGYNIDNGGNTMGTFSPEHIQKMREAQNNPELIESKRQASLGEKNWFYGKHHNENTKAIMSEKARNRPVPNNKRSVVCEETGEVFLTITEAAKKYGVSLSSIYNYCTGKCNSKKGLHFKFAEVKRQ